MGHVKIDIAKSDRSYAVKYALNDAAGVRSLLRDRHRISSARFRGDTAASDILIDLHSAINSAGLTERQTEAITWVYGADITQEKAAAIMEITQPTVKQSVDEAVEKIAAVYRRWDYGEVVCEHTEEGVAA
ncbi:sigma factor-like helix-turn-helix DNA-binding protein [Paenibacillus terrae]|uniref:sigma factor-like helix-turn-helix DNA-binding protein n=1 Tax=Paenibacillus terrae TaxID=159743 RepID=UPI0011EB5CA9|nr:sigma factor-like helix-turn-helix DNA-binding protein [Paenibacillus terrae]